MWYDAPVMPFIAIFSAITLYYLFQQLDSKAGITDSWFTRYIPYLLIVATFLFPYKKIFSSFENTDEQMENAAYYHLSDYLRNANNGNDTSLNNSLIIYNANTVAHVQFYIDQLAEKGIDISLSTYPDIDSCNRVIVAQEEISRLIEDYYNYELIGDAGTIKKYRLLGRNEKDIPTTVNLKESWDGFRIYEIVEEH